MASKTIITCALTGGMDNIHMNPAIPVTPAQIVQSALEAERAGAAIAHIHVRDPETTRPSMDVALYRAVVEGLKEAGSKLVINLTTGPGAQFVPGDCEDRPTPGEGTTLTSPRKRVAHIEELKPEVCTLDVATLNFGEHVFMNTPEHLRDMARRIGEAGTKPELEVFEPGHLRLALQMVKDGLIKNPPMFQLCLGIPWGAPATPETVLYMKSMLPENAVWSGFGISRMQFPIAALVCMLGGHVRVGLEDNLYMSRGELAASNAALVERAVIIIEAIGGAVASPDEAREILGLNHRV